MTIPYTAGEFGHEDDLVRNMVAWLEANVDDIKYRGNTPTVYDSQPYPDVKLPAIFVYLTESNSDKQKSFRKYDLIMNLEIVLFHRELHRDTSKNIRRWATNVRDVVNGNIAGEIKSHWHEVVVATGKAYLTTHAFPVLKIHPELIAGNFGENSDEDRSGDRRPWNTATIIFIGEKYHGE